MGRARPFYQRGFSVTNRNAASLIEIDDEAIKAVSQVWFNRISAPKFMHRHGFRNITVNSIDYAVAAGKLHKPKKMGNQNFWHKDWLLAWIEAM